MAAVNQTDQGCDRCGNLFDPSVMHKIAFMEFVSTNEENDSYQLCVNCKRLLVQTFNFRKARTIMEAQNAAVSRRQNTTA